MDKVVYTDDKDLKIYESLPDKDFKEFFMAYFKYKKGDNVKVDDFSSPITYALFLQYSNKLDVMEDNYYRKRDKRVNASRENGKKGGRPRKREIADLSPSNSQDGEIYHQEGDNGSNGLKIGNTSELNNNTITDNKTEEDMGTFICNIEGEQQEVKKNDMSSIDRLIPAQNKCMALRQVKPYLSQDENLRRLNDSLGVFLKGVDKEEKTEYYQYITQVYLNQVNAFEREYSKILS